MGVIRKRTHALPCPTCMAEMDATCNHRRTGKPMKNFHKARTFTARDEVLNQKVAAIEDQDEEEFWQWAFRYLDIDGSNGYHGDF